MRGLAIVALLLVLVGCMNLRGQRFVKDGVTQEEASRDYAEAQAEAIGLASGYGSGNPLLVVDQRNEIIAARMRAKGYRVE